MLVSVAASAQSFTYLNIQTDPRGVAMAGASEALEAGAFAVDVNPAAMSLSSKSLDVQASYTMWSPKTSDLKIASLGAFYRFGKFSLGIAGRYFMEPSYDIIDANAKTTGSFTPKNIAFGLGMSYSFAEKFSVGLSARLLSFNPAEEAKVASFAADLSFMYDGGAFKAALGLNNLGPKVTLYKEKGWADSSYSLPTMVKAGASYSIAGFTGSAEADFIFGGSIMAGAGVEYDIAKIFAVRAGYHYGKGDAAIPSHVSVGAGVHFAGFKLDASFIPSIGTGGSGLMFALGYSF